MFKLSNDMLLYIFEFICTRDLIFIRSTNKRLYNIIRNFNGKLDNENMDITMTSHKIVHRIRCYIC